MTDFSEKQMREVWDQCAGTQYSMADERGLERLRRDIEKRRRASRIRRRSAYALSSCAACMVMFLVGWHFAKVSNEPQKEVTIITSGGSMGDHTLPDGSRVRLNGNSSLTYYNDLKGKERIVCLDGEGYFDVQHDESKPFIVKMDHIDVKVLGTSFDAECYPGTGVERVILKNGSVQVVRHDNNETFGIVPDQMYTYSTFDGKVTVSSVDASSACRWYEPYLQFKNSRLEDILTNIEHRYHVSLRYCASVSLEKRVSMTIIGEPLPVILDVLSSLLPIRCELLSDELVITDRSKKSVTKQHRQSDNETI